MPLAGVERPTVTDDIPILIFGDCEEGGPFGEVLEVEINVVIFGERVKVCEIHFEEVRRAERAEGCHGVCGG